MTTDELIKALMNLADLGIVNYKAANDTIRAAAFLIDVQAHQIEDLKEQVYQLHERIGIMEDGNQVTIAPEPGSIRKATWEEWWPGDCALIMTGEENAWRCSNCDAKFIDREGYKFCPNCGAFMVSIPPKEVY